MMIYAAGLYKSTNCKGFQRIKKTLKRIQGLKTNTNKNLDDTCQFEASFFEVDDIQIINNRVRG